MTGTQVLCRTFRGTDLGGYIFQNTFGITQPCRRRSSDIHVQYIRIKALHVKSIHSLPQNTGGRLTQTPKYFTGREERLVLKTGRPQKKSSQNKKKKN